VRSFQKRADEEAAVVEESGRRGLKRQSAGSGITLDLKSSSLSPAPPSLVPGYLSFGGSVATVIILPTLTVLSLDRRNGMHGWLLSELQPPPLALCLSCAAAAVVVVAAALLEDALARRVVLVRETWLLERRVATLVEACVAGRGADGRWGYGRADHGNRRGHIERQRGSSGGSSGGDGEGELGLDGS